MKKSKQNSQTAPAASGGDGGDGGDGESDLDLGEFAIETDSDYELADEDYLRFNLLEADLDDESAQVTRTLAPDLIVVDSDTDVDLAARFGGGECGDTASVRWTQISGVSVEPGGEPSGVTGRGRLVRVPDVSVAQDLLFEVEALCGGERLVQEVTLCVQPTSSKGARSSGKQRRAEGLRTGEIGQAVGKVWGAVRVFFGGKSAPRDEQ